MVKIDQSTTTKMSDDISPKHLKLRVKFDLVPFFFQLLGHGFTIKVRTGCSIKDLLCKQLSIQEDYLAERITTIFLNSKVVDDLNSTIVNEGATLALSGAMPGLVGAVLRSGSFYAAMRREISHKKSKSSTQSQPANITLKLMNLVVKELGPEFLQQGVWLKGQTLWEYLESYMNELKAGCITCELDSKPVELNNLRAIDWSDDMILLQVHSEALDQATQ